MNEVEYAGLRDSIAAIGQTTPIVLMGGKVIDGRARLRACQELGFEPQTINTEEAATDALAHWIEAQNLHRRHLSDAQRAMVAGRLAKWRGVTLEAAAEKMGVSRANVAKAKAIHASGDARVISLAEHGRLSVNAAHKLVARRGRPAGPAFETKTRRFTDEGRKILAENHPFTPAMRADLAALGRALAALDHPAAAA